MKYVKTKIISILKIQYLKVSDLTNRNPDNRYTSSGPTGL